MCFMIFIWSKTNWNGACLKNGQHLTQKIFMRSLFKNWCCWFPYILNFWKKNKEIKKLLIFGQFSVFLFRKTSKSFSDAHWIIKFSVRQKNNKKTSPAVIKFFYISFLTLVKLSKSMKHFNWEWFNLVFYLQILLT